MDNPFEARKKFLKTLPKIDKVPMGKSDEPKKGNVIVLPAQSVFSKKDKPKKKHFYKSKRAKRKAKKNKQPDVFPYSKEHWLVTNISMLKWQKTEEFQKWRKRQFLEQGGTCYYCDEILKGMRQNIEHIVPKSRGGTNSKSNLVIACSKCNKDKGTKILSAKERKELKLKNAKKKGTYHKIKDLYLTEEEEARRLYEIYGER